MQKPTTLVQRYKIPKNGTTRHNTAQNDGRQPRRTCKIWTIARLAENEKKQHKTTQSDTKRHNATASSLDVCAQSAKSHVYPSTIQNDIKRHKTTKHRSKRRPPASTFVQNLKNRTNSEQIEPNLIKSEQSHAILQFGANWNKLH